jgi:cobalt-zinc-cadmium resistance protein CzcA
VLLLLQGDNIRSTDCGRRHPFSMLFAFIGMREFGMAANLRDLGAIDFGMVVDGSVVMIENTSVHRLQNHGTSPPTKQLSWPPNTVVRPIFSGY